jgi:acetyl esterase/lipase
VVVSAEYRSATQRPFPAAIDDCHAAWHWFIDSANRLGFDLERLAIGGQSAGASLAASLVQRLHDERGPQPAAQWLFCPMLDDRTAARRDLDDMHHYIWDNRYNERAWRTYLAMPPGAPTLPPYAAPARRQDLSGLPQAWIGVGDVDLFYDESRRYAERLWAAGVKTVLDVVPGAPHAFEAWGRRTHAAASFMERAQRWLAGAVGGRPPGGATDA